MAVSTKAQQFSNYLNQMPGQAKEEQQTQEMVAQLRQADAGSVSDEQIQKASAAVVGAQGQIAREETAKQAKVAQTLTGQALTELTLDQQKNLLSRSQKLEQDSRDNQTRLFNLNSKLNDELVTRQQKFQRDSLMRYQFTERQLMDYAIIKSKSDEDLQNWAQTSENLHDLKMQALKAAHAKISQELTLQFELAEQQRDNAQIQRLTQAKVEAERKMQKAANDDKNAMAAFTAGGALVGGVIGTFAGGNTAAGIMIGSGAGSLAGGVYNNNINGKYKRPW